MSRSLLSLQPLAHSLLIGFLGPFRPLPLWIVRTSGHAFGGRKFELQTSRSSSHARLITLVCFSLAFSSELSPACYADPKGSRRVDDNRLVFGLPLSLFIGCLLSVP